MRVLAVTSQSCTVLSGRPLASRRAVPTATSRPVVRWRSFPLRWAYRSPLRPGRPRRRTGRPARRGRACRDGHRGRLGFCNGTGQRAALWPAAGQRALEVVDSLLPPPARAALARAPRGRQRRADLIFGVDGTVGRDCSPVRGLVPSGWASTRTWMTRCGCWTRPWSARPARHPQSARAGHFRRRFARSAGGSWSGLGCGWCVLP